MSTVHRHRAVGSAPHVLVVSEAAGSDHDSVTRVDPDATALVLDDGTGHDAVVQHEFAEFGRAPQRDAVSSRDVEQLRHQTRSHAQRDPSPQRGQHGPRPHRQCRSNRLQRSHAVGQPW
jgi:hypothetical protein